MYITLTNATINHLGNKISINTDLIATVHDGFVTRENGLTEKVTYVFCPPHGTWEVSESLTHIISILNAE